LFVLIATAVFVVGAQAQTPTSTADIIPNTRTPPLSETALADRAFRDLINCVVRYQPERTRNLLDTIPGTRDEERILFSFQSRMETCYDSFRTGRGALLIQPNLVRGVIAETYFGREFPSGIPAEGLASPEIAARWARPRAADGAVSQMEMLHAMARCVTLRQPAAVGTLLRAAPLSGEERAALRVLQPDLSACLDSGVQFESSRQSLRALLAEAALHYGEARHRGFAQPGAPSAQSE
jgi:hypothetical protein